jgi:hypothetical protein
VIEELNTSVVVLARGSGGGGGGGGGGTLYEVQDCVTGVQWIADDLMGALMPLAGDFIIVQDNFTMMLYCVEVIGTTSSGPPTHSTTIGGFFDCADCQTYLGGGGGGGGGGGP